MFKRLLAGCLLVLVTMGGLFAQEAPKNEVVAGYSYSFAKDFFANLSGFQVSYTRYFTDHVGITGEFGVNLHSSSKYPFTRLNTGTVLVGPQLAFNRTGRVSPFAHVLFGAGRIVIGGAFPTNGFAVEVGGGVDVKVTRHLSVRAIQADYQPIVTGYDFGNIVIRNRRLSGGLNFRF